MRYTIVTLVQMREILTTMIQQLLSLVLLILSQKGVAGFFLAPTPIRRIRSNSLDSALLAAESDPPESVTDEASSSIRDNDLSMFLAQDDEEQPDGFDALEFFMTQDESIQKLEEVEQLFREEPTGIMMEEITGVVPVPSIQVHNKDFQHIATTNPIASDKIQMRKDTGIGIIEEEIESKKLLYYNYDGSLSKIKENLVNIPHNYYTE